MLLFKSPVSFLCIAVVISTLTACANGPGSNNLEQSVAADPRLQNNPAVLGDTNSQVKPTSSSVSLPADFPDSIPKYPNAQLIEIPTANTAGNNSEKQTVTRWQSSDPSNVIANFYRSQFNNNNWQILQQPQDDTEGTFTVKSKNLLLKVTIKPTSVTDTASNQPQNSTELLIEYTPSNTNKIGAETVTNSGKSSPNSNTQVSGPILPDDQITNSETNQANTTKETLEPTEFIDLNQAPPEWRKQIEELGKLGVLSLAKKPNSSDVSNNQKQLFEPDKIITRREYARWLVAANNVMYANNPAKKIRLASTKTQPIFKDVLPQDPDFPAIQGLAETGLIPSSLSGDATAVLFRPDAPLTRENLLMWKVPLDTRQGLPNANLEAVKQTWGFQDTEKIDPKALRAILADFQNADKSNIRRVFGYTTLFQPKKAVTRAEAAAALSYFGLQSEGMSTTEALKLQGK
ncbi:MAG: S-layer homology domain-containing protein [Nostocales cyanobacterium]|nr:MAG: S-layer homology domain-containing protein [Nostocales cyanobacterium]TAF15828.1 MAG: S-layer homology domain-containing protein [Nostocales cyanobacterium]